MVTEAAGGEARQASGRIRKKKKVTINGKSFSAEQP